MTAQEIRLANDDYFCLGENYKENSFFESKINLLLSGLSQIPIKLQIDKGYYYSTALGETTDRTYGSVQCRGLEMNKLCWNCVDKAVKDIKGKCPNKKEAIVWYDNCMVRYSDQSNFSIMKDSPTFYTTNDILIPINNPLGVILDGFINDLISEATSNGSPLSSKYATRAVNFTNSDKVYGLAQCTSDISSANCSKCLTGAFTRFKDIENSYEEQVARIIRPSCFLRYELYPFYDANTIAPPTNSTIIPNTASKRKKSVKLVVIIFVPSIIIVITIICFWYFCLRTTIAEDIFDGVDKIQSDGYSQPSFVTIRAATNNFSDDNKLGQGGFGSVYKGTLPDSQEIAVKRLSKNSCQGEEEFKNEAVLVVKLQHRNLVRLLGFCLDREERLLIYELMPNASLNHFIFDLPRCVFLSWKRRYRIIGGIARGLLYLHEDSRLKIIHRDLKASNVLLDADMNPKIADFGMARMFLANQTEANTSRIVGTFGYMAPEYAMHGHFSVKSDVFSFGVLVLEILSGRRNNSFYGSEGAQNLLSYAWRHWEEGTAMDLLDARLRENCSTVEVIRCIHIGLLCVQEDVSERPTMTSVINMLNNHSAILSIPSPPPTLFMQNSEEVNTNITQRESENATVNGLSMTEFYPR